jgi:hypothetical protein
MSRIKLGEADGLEDLKRSHALAEQSNAPDDIGRALNNLSNMCWNLGLLEEGTRYRLLGREAVLRFGDKSALRWSDHEQFLDDYLRGNLADALVQARYCLETHRHTYLEGAARLIAAEILAVQGDVAGALVEAERAVAAARTVADAQQLGPALVSFGYVLHAAGREAESRQTFAEVLASAGMLRYHEWIQALPLTLVEQGGGEAYTAAAPRAPNPWVQAASAAVAGELGDASRLYGEIGARYYEAWTALLAAERGEGVDLTSAHAYFVRQSAVPYVRRCERLLQASA